jgi:acid stress-induced BolA-like protein IbaG/YrbA
LRCVALLAILWAIVMMMANEGGGNNNDDDDDVFVYTGGDQEVPFDTTHAIVDPSVKMITLEAFYFRCFLASIEIHDGVKFITESSFSDCASLRNIKLVGVRLIERNSFFNCAALEDVEFGIKLETIGNNAFFRTSLRQIKLPKVRFIGDYAFSECEQLTDVELLSEDLQSIGGRAFGNCPHLRRIAIPLKSNLFAGDVFIGCHNLSQIDLVGGIHRTISSLLLGSWRNEMNREIDRINYVLPSTPTDEKTGAIKVWMEKVIAKIQHYKLEHYKLLKDNMTQLELALWKANLPSVDAASRQEARVTCGADIIIPHVLSFLNDDDVFPLLDYNLAIIQREVLLRFRNHIFDTGEIICLDKKSCVRESKDGRCLQIIIVSNRFDNEGLFDRMKIVRSYEDAILEYVRRLEKYKSMSLVCHTPSEWKRKEDLIKYGVDLHE